MVAHLRPGETLLVHGGSSGIGTMAIQLARAVGAKVAVTAGTREKLERCAELGADILINYREQDFVAEVKEATGGAGADVILDNMGAKYLDRNVRALAVNGRLAIIGMQGGRKGELDIGTLLAKRAAVSATSLRAPAAGGEGGHRGGRTRARLAVARRRQWCSRSPDRRPRTPMSEAPAAHRVVEESGHIGKVLLIAP
ncbi:zinc-binding dehydrogenase [Streptomyces thinghirensis]|nr:zinc-binding dehydrogenase [Streptomyces thinghirensis]